MVDESNTRGGSKNRHRITAQEATQRIEALEAAVAGQSSIKALWCVVGVLGAACIVLLGGLVWVLQSPSLYPSRVDGNMASEESEAEVSETVRARSFVVVDESGRELASLTASEFGDSGRLLIGNREGRELVDITSGENGDGSIDVGGRSGVDLIRLTSTSGGDGVVATSNMRGEDAVLLTAGARGEGVVATMAGPGKARVMITSTEAGGGALATFDSNGSETTFLGSSDGRGGAMRVANVQGAAAVNLASSDSGHGYIIMADGIGRELIRMSASRLNSSGVYAGFMRFSNDEGREVIQLDRGVTGAGRVTVFDPSGESAKNTLHPIHPFLMR